MTAEKLDCRVAGVCSGCDWIQRSPADQMAAKVAAITGPWVAAGLPAADVASLAIRSIAPGGLRDRADLIYRRTGGEMRLGLYELDKKEIVDLADCPSMSGPLRAWLKDFRASPPPIEAGSLRLRVSPEGKRGAWLDFSNADVKRLLDERTWLEWLSGLAIVEIGQKRKRLAVKGDRLGLVDPVLDYWFPTFIDGKAVPLYSAIGTFTQVGVDANRVLVEEYLKALGGPVSGRWLELGSGIGNLTLPLAAAGASVTAIEIDELAIEGLNRATAEAKLSERVSVAVQSFHLPSQTMAAMFQGVAGVVADPPRSGLIGFCDLLETYRPEVIVYVSCYAESFTTDAARFYGHGYRLARIVGVDQFPQTSHCEYVARFERKS